MSTKSREIDIVTGSILRFSSKSQENHEKMYGWQNNESAFVIEIKFYLRRKLRKTFANDIESAF